MIKENLPADILHSFDKVPTEICPDTAEASERIAAIIAEAIKAHKASEPFKLGLTIGRSPQTVYAILKQMCKDGKLSFANVAIYSIDEYYPCSSDNEQSRWNRLHEDLLRHIDIKAENIHIPDGSIPSENVSAWCAEFDKQARDMDLLVIGLGTKGQIGINDIGTSLQSRTRVVQMSYTTRKRHAKNFNGDLTQTPYAAITMGIGTMMSAKKVILMAWGESKADAVKKIVEVKQSIDVPASCFQSHPDATLFVDKVAAEQLTIEDCPWLIGPCNWTPKFCRKAVVWLCQKVGKPILKLTLQDYLENSLGELIEKYGSFDKVNINVFNDLQHTITGWPGGKPGCNDTTRPVSSTPWPKKVLIFSPHPDDDVISMGGTFIRLVHQGHNVHVAYETSGDVAVHDDVVIQHMDAAKQLGFGDRIDEVKKLVEAKKNGAAEPRELLEIKAAIRRSEARGACRSFGLSMDNVHFLNLPFYESGGVTKLPRTQVDVDIIKELLKKIKPDQVYMAGDLADPHGTHRVCTEAAMEAMEQLSREGESWVDSCTVWLYRGAWMEWELGRVDMAVPLSPDEVVEKRHAIYHHLSQKDIVPFPGDDPREFWQRAEERTSNTAKMYDSLGMAEYQAIEVFLKLPR